MLRESILAICAIVALNGTSHGFLLTALAQLDAGAAPSSGLFRFATDSDGQSKYTTSNNWLLSATNVVWQNERDAILNSSWIAIDSGGGPGHWSLGAGGANRPAYSDTNNTANYPKFVLNGIDSGFQGLAGGTATHLAPGPSGWGLAPQRPGIDAGVFSQMNDVPADISGNDIDTLQSVYLGHFAMTEQNVILVGGFRVGVRRDSGIQIGPTEGFELNLDGTTRTFGAYTLRLAQVRGPNSTIDLYLVDGVPSSGVLAVFGLASVMGARRRR